MTKINAEISIIASYDDSINIIISDKDVGTRFVDLTLTREQFINATMNRLMSVGCNKAEVFNLDKVGKKQEYRKFEFPLPYQGSHNLDKIVAAKTVGSRCPSGWTPDTYFDSQDSFFEKDGVHYVRTMICRWV